MVKDHVPVVEGVIQCGAARGRGVGGGVVHAFHRGGALFWGWERSYCRWRVGGGEPLCLGVRGSIAGIFFEVLSAFARGCARCVCMRRVVWWVKDVESIFNACCGNYFRGVLVGGDYCCIVGSEGDGSVSACDVVHGEEVLANCGVCDRWYGERSILVGFDLQGARVCRGRRGGCRGVSNNTPCEGAHVGCGLGYVRGAGA